MKRFTFLLLNCLFLNFTLLGQLTVDHLSKSVSLGSGVASGPDATAMGNSQATGLRSTAMGLSVASHDYTTAMGSSIASNSYAVAGGLSTASGSFATAFGRTIASGTYSVAMGRGVNTNGKTGAFFFGDDDMITRENQEDNQFVCRFRGGYYFISGFSNPNSTGDLGVRLPASGNAWLSISDQKRKENFIPLDDVDVLEKLSTVSFGSWNYIGLNPSQDRHYGIMAQEFYELFGQDEFGTIGCDTLVNPIDMIGITMSAIKGMKIQLDDEREKVIQLQNEISKHHLDMAQAHETLRSNYETRLIQQDAQIELLTQQMKELKQILSANDQ